jgi:hypothetical protein
MTHSQSREHVAAKLKATYPDVNDPEIKAVLHHIVHAVIAGDTQRAAIDFLTDECRHPKWDQVEGTWAWLEETFGDDIVTLRAIVKADERPYRARWQSLYEEMIGEPPPDDAVPPVGPLLH